MQVNYSPTLINIYLFIICLQMFLYFVERVINANFAKEKDQLVKNVYPDLSKKELKFRKTSLNNYSRINFIGSFNRVIEIIFGILFFISIIAVVVCAFSDNFSGICFSLALFFFSMSIVSLCAPSFQKQQNFWQQYLKEHPDNPLKVVPTPPEPKYLMFVKYWKINAVFRIVCALFSLYVGYMLMQLNL